MRRRTILAKRSDDDRTNSATIEAYVKQHNFHKYKQDLFSNEYNYKDDLSSNEYVSGELNRGRSDDRNDGTNMVEIKIVIAMEERNVNCGVNMTTMNDKLNYITNYR